MVQLGGVRHLLSVAQSKGGDADIVKGSLRALAILAGHAKAVQLLISVLFPSPTPP